MAVANNNHGAGEETRNRERGRRRNLESNDERKFVGYGRRVEKERPMATFRRVSRDLIYIIRLHVFSFLLI